MFLRRAASHVVNPARFSAIAQSSSPSFSNAANQPSSNSGTRRTVDDVTQSLLSAPLTRVPKPLTRIAAALKSKFTKDNIDPNLKGLLDGASAQLYYDCANNFNYEKLCASFGLPDYMSSWYKLTLMHSWMVLMRVHVSLDADAYLRLQRGLLATMWMDVDQRLAIVGEELKQVMTAKSDMKHMHGLHLQTFLEYDEGFLHDDRVLAAAVWRCLYMQRSCDPIHVLRVVTYIRSTVAWLDTLDVDTILVDGVRDWRQLKPKDSTAGDNGSREEL